MSTPLILHNHTKAQWFSLLHDAQSHCNIQLDAELETYLVLMLENNTTKTHLGQNPLAPAYLEAVYQELNTRQRQQLQQIGDQCLLIVGLFPEKAHQRDLKVSYYITMGQSAYQQVALHHTDTQPLFTNLSDRFVAVMDVLQSIRRLDQDPTNMDYQQVHTLWSETRSPTAKGLLEQKWSHHIIIPNEDTDSKKPH